MFVKSLNSNFVERATFENQRSHLVLDFSGNPSIFIVRFLSDISLHDWYITLISRFSWDIRFISSYVKYNNIYVIDKRQLFLKLFKAQKINKYTKVNNPSF